MVVVIIAAVAAAQVLTGRDALAEGPGCGRIDDGDL